MKFLFLSTIGLAMLGFSACAADASNDDLVGDWEFVGTPSSKGKKVECPDYLLLKDNGTYFILNDCHGLNPRFPMIEKGKWAYDFDKKKLTFRDRIFESNLYFGATKDVLIMGVVRVSKDVINLSVSTWGTLIFVKRGLSLESQ